MIAGEAVHPRGEAVGDPRQRGSRCNRQTQLPLHVPSSPPACCSCGTQRVTVRRRPEPNQPTPAKGIARRAGVKPISVRNLIDRHPDLQVVGVAADYDGVAGSRGWHAGDRHLLPAFSRAGEMTAIDIISGGRLELGIGAGWNEKSLRTSRRQPARPAVGLARNRGLIT